MKKLVRDEIPSLIELKGEKAEFYTAGDYEMRITSLDKIVEEAKEVRDAGSREDIIKELGDVEQIKMKIMELFGISNDEIEEARLEKLKERGGFDKNIILEIDDNK